MARLSRRKEHDWEEGLIALLRELRHRAETVSSRGTGAGTEQLCAEALGMAVAVGYFVADTASGSWRTARWSDEMGCAELLIMVQITVMNVLRQAEEHDCTGAQGCAGALAWALEPIVAGSPFLDGREEVVERMRLIQLRYMMSWCQKAQSHRRITVDAGGVGGGGGA